MEREGEREENIGVGLLMPPAESQWLLLLLLSCCSCRLDWPPRWPHQGKNS